VMCIFSYHLFCGKAYRCIFNKS